MIKKTTMTEYFCKSLYLYISLSSFLLLFLSHHQEKSEAMTRNPTVSKRNRFEKMELSNGNGGEKWFHCIAQ